MKLLSRANTKTLKGEKFGYITSILHLAPYNLSGYQVCANATTCIAPCLYTAGRGRFDNVQAARIRKTRYFFEDRESFMRDLVDDIEKSIKYAKKRGLIPVFRLNGTSDIPWEKIRVKEYRNIFEAFPDVQFYDYTKIPGRSLPNNYHVTFSHDGLNWEKSCRDALYNGQNVAVVFDKIPEKFRGWPVIDGDLSDLRFLDKNTLPLGLIVGLKAKGNAKKDLSGFVVRA